jgi:hypothetical protein
VHSGQMQAAGKCLYTYMYQVDRSPLQLRGSAKTSVWLVGSSRSERRTSMHAPHLGCDRVPSSCLLHLYRYMCATSFTTTLLSVSPRS